MRNRWREISKVNPQRENGHRRISNEVFQALIAAKLSGAVYQILLVVIDKTWGYEKLHSYISFSQIRKAANLSQQSVSKAVQSAEKLRIIVVERDGTGKGNKYLFNKHYDTWLTSQPNHTSQLNHTRTSQPVTPSTIATTENNIKNKRNNTYTYGNKKEKVCSDDPDKYIKGKYGHMVRR